MNTVSAPNIMKKMKPLNLKHFYSISKEDLLAQINTFKTPKKITSEYPIYFNDLSLDTIDLDVYISNIETFIETTTTKDDVIMLRPVEVIVDSANKVKPLVLAELPEVLVKLEKARTLLAKAEPFSTVKPISESISKHIEKLNLYSSKDIDIKSVVSACLNAAKDNLETKGFTKQLLVMEPAENNIYLARRISSSTFSDNALFLISSKQDYIDINTKLVTEAEIKREADKKAEALNPTEIKVTKAKVTKAKVTKIEA